MLALAGRLVDTSALPCHGLPNQTLAGTLAGLPVEADHHRTRISKLVAEDRQQEFTVADEVGFIGFVGFHGVGRRNCLRCAHHRHLTPLLV